MNLNPAVFQMMTGGESFSPIDIPTLALWLEQDDRSSVTSSGGLVTQWRDKSSNANHFNAPVGEEPKLESAGINFDGSDSMQSISQISLAGQFTISIVLDTNTLVAGTRMFLGSSSTDEKFGTVSASGNLFFRVFTTGDSSQAFPFAQDQLGILTITRNTNNKVDLRVNGGAPVRLFGDVAQAGTMIFDRIGKDNSTAFFNGRINHLIVDESVAHVAEIVSYHQKKI